MRIDISISERINQIITPEAFSELRKFQSNMLNTLRGFKTRKQYRRFPETSQSLTQLYDKRRVFVEKNPLESII